MRHNHIRLSLGFSQAQWEAIKQALRLRYHCQGDPELQTLGILERNNFLRQAIWAIAKAVVRQNVEMQPLACDLRKETKEEMAERLEKSIPEVESLLSPSKENPDLEPWADVLKRLRSAGNG